jgi:MarR family transcriptional regulator, lower aerobic nicotinate degradation pathway regulator
MAEGLRGDNVLLQMFRTAVATRELMQRAVAGTGISPAEFAVLSAIGVLRSVPPTELATALRVPPTSISRHVARIVDAGLAVRSPNPADRRSYLLELTDEGRAVARAVAPRVRSLVDQLAARADVPQIESALVELEEAARSIALDTPTARQ